MQFTFAIVAMAAIMGLTHAAAITPTVIPENPFDQVRPSKGHLTSTPLQTTFATVVQAASAATVTTMTVELVNNANVDLWTQHTPSNTLLSGGSSGALAKGSTGTYVLKPGYAGSVFINRHDFGKHASDSQIETNFGPEAGNVDTSNKVTIDVSYVSGYTYPIVCTCGSGAFVSGCETNLWAVKDSKCLNPNAFNGCTNPNQDGKHANDPFFAPCAGKAYTFPSDDAAVSHNLCDTGKFVCTIGSNGKGDKQ
jgi:hypothetical protein